MWVYCQSTGQLFSPDNKLVSVGYAGGNCGKNPEGKNNPKLQGEKSIGPLPCGIYTFGIPVLKSHLGPFAIPLIPDVKNNMLGRSGFFMHGDTTPSGNASEGCIIVSRSVRNLCAASSDKYLRVVDYIDAKILK